MGRPIWIGDTVHFVYQNHVCRPGLITDMQYPGAPYVNLQVTLDGPIYEDGKPPQRALWIHKSPHSKTLSEGHWHSMQECPYLLSYIREQNAPKALVSNSPQQERISLPQPLGSRADETS